MTALNFLFLLLLRASDYSTDILVSQSQCMERGMLRIPNLQIKEKEEIVNDIFGFLSFLSLSYLRRKIDLKKEEDIFYSHHLFSRSIVRRYKKKL